MDFRFEYFLHKNKVLHDKTIVLDAYKAIYVYIAKVACRSLKLMCADVLINKSVSDPYERIHMVEEPSFSVKDDESVTKYKDYFKFCFVRNPWDRVVSCFVDKITNEKNLNTHWCINGVAKPLARYGNVFRAGMFFEEFVHAINNIPDKEADTHFKSQSAFIIDESGREVVDFIGRFERLQEDFSRVKKKLGLPVKELSHFGSSNRKDYKTYYNEKTKGIIQKRYIRDIEMFGYEF